MSDGGLRQIFSKHIPKAMWVPVETGSTALGVPDSHYCFPGGASGWIENKLVSSGWRVGMRPMQVSWLERYSRYGGRCFIAVRKDGDFYLFRGSDARAVDELGLRAGFLVTCTGGQSRWDWRDIAAWLSR